MDNWAEIEGFEGLYAVSDSGEVRRIAPGPNTFPGKTIKGDVAAGYRRVLLVRDGQVSRHLVHRLVAFAFLGPPPAGCQVNHRDGNPSNNHVSNLEWVTRSENRRHAHRLGLSARGEKHHAARLTEARVAEIRRRYPAETQAALAREFGVSQVMVSKIVRGLNWA